MDFCIQVTILIPVFFLCWGVKELLHWEKFKLCVKWIQDQPFQDFFFSEHLWLGILSLLTLHLKISKSGSKSKKASHKCLHAGSGSLALSVLFWSMYERSVFTFNNLITKMRVDVFSIFLLRSKGLILKKNTGYQSLMLENSGIVLVSLLKGLKLNRNHLSAYHATCQWERKTFAVY